MMVWLKSSVRLFATTCFFLSVLLASSASSQTTATGAVTVNVVDPTGAVVPDAGLQLRDLGTNEIRKAATLTNGTYTYPNLRFGTYELRVSKSGFTTEVFASVLVQTARITTVNVSLRIATTQATVEVRENVTPIVDRDSSTLATTIDTKNVVNLPMAGRNVMSLAFLVPGWASTFGPNDARGTWNNLPGGAIVSADFDGVPGKSNRFRSGGFNYGTTVAQPRIEDVAEMTVQTGQLDLGGSGTSAMHIAIVGRHGTNQFHGRLFDDFRNTALNANSWFNNSRTKPLPRAIIKRNEFGGNIGGPIIKNKLFFFGTFSTFIEPGSNAVSTRIFNPSAQQGNFTYTNTSGVTKTVNVLGIAGAAGFPSTAHPNAADQFAKINGVLSQGSVTQGTDPNIATLNFQNPRKTVTYFPTVRGDYVYNDRLRFNLSYSQTKNRIDKNYAPQYPGGIDPLDQTSFASNGRIAGLGIDWTARPTLVNQFRGGYMYEYSAFSPENLSLDYSTIHRETWNYGQSFYGSNYPRRTISSFYPLLSANDTLTWQKGAHAFVFGGSWYTEHDHYWNGPGGEPDYTYGIVGQDPLSAVFNTALFDAPTTQRTNAENLYAELTQRISAVNIGVGRPLDPATKQYKPFGAYNLNELMGAFGFWAQDSWHLKPNLTLNYGLRWDVVGDDYDVDGAYSAPPTLGDLWGPTPVGALFEPGKLGGVQNPVFQAQKHAYHTNCCNLSPAIAVAWTPNVGGGFLGKFVGKEKTVIRAGYSLRYYTEGAQQFWAYASNSGSFFYQFGNLTANPTPTLGNFVPGSLTYGDPLPAYLLTPAAYQTTVSASQLFDSQTFRAMNPNIHDPYVEQWNLGIQRQLGASSALEVRYVGNLSLHQWLSYNINETNIFENGFLQEFLHAQQNLALNRAGGCGARFDPVPGCSTNALPIFAAAFGSATSNYTSGAFITNLDTGAAGSLANALANNATFFCNMVGSVNFPACASRGVTGPGAGYPLNFWQVNPFATGRSVLFLDSAGHTNYHALQIEFRQRPTYGMQFNVNYTLSKSLGVAAQDGIQGEGNNIYYTARNPRLNYTPSLFDIRHVFRASGTYDLPFGKGRALLNYGSVVDRLVGGWDLGTIITIQSGSPLTLTGGYDTWNTNDSGVNLNGVTLGDLRNGMGVHKTGNPWVQIFDPNLIGLNGAAATAYLTPATTPGVLGSHVYVWGPGWYNADLSVNKSIRLRESLRITLQTEFLNVFNHPTFGFLTTPTGTSTSGPGIRDTNFGQSTSGPGGPRNIELRLNIEF